MYKFTFYKFIELKFNIYQLFPSGWVINNDDLEPECPTNNTDECNVCNGDGISCAPPLNIVADGSRSEVALSWSMNINASSYNIYYENNEFVSSTNELIYIDSDLGYELEYCYYITSINDLGIEGPPSEIVCAETLPYNLVELEAVIYPSDGFIEIYKDGEEVGRIYVDDYMASESAAKDWCFKD